jgi:hypothetical protein
MATSETVLRVFVAAPSDIDGERGVVGEVVNDWNTHRGKSAATRLEMVWWGNSARPQMGGRAQALINDQVLDDADIVVGIFWSRFGTPTGAADSGTEEELRRSIEAGKPVMLYFCKRDIPQNNLDITQFSQIQTFRRDMEQKGLFGEYVTNEEFKTEFARHLADTVDELLAESNDSRTEREVDQRDIEMEQISVPGMGSTFVAPLAGIEIPMPTVRAKVTDRDRARFIRDGLKSIHDYFQDALAQLKSSNSSIECDFEDLNAVQFACRIYVNGNQQAQCKVWHGDSMGSPAIYYATDDVLSTTGNSYNEWLSISDETDDLRLQAHMSLFGDENSVNAMLPEDAAKYLWLQLTKYLSS